MNVQLLTYFNYNEKVRAEYGRPPSRSCGGLGALRALLGAFGPHLIGSRIRMPTFGGVYFLTFFYLSAPYICFGFFETLGGLF